MKKELFEEIFGSDFKTTNYKVNTTAELFEVLIKQERELELSLYKIEDDPEGVLYEFPEGSDIDDRGMHALIDCYYFSHFFTKLEFTKDFYILLVNRLKFMNSHQNKMELLENELKDLEKEFQNNPYNYVLTPNNYFNELRSQWFIENLWKQHKIENWEAYQEFEANFQNSKYNPDNLMEEEIWGGTLEGSFARFFDILKKFTVIKHQISLLNNSQDAKEVVIYENESPSVFMDGYSCQLFIYLIQNEEKNIGRAYVTKYFNLFKEEKRIKKGAKAVRYISFLKKTYKTKFDKLDKLDNRVTFGDEEIDDLANIEKMFKNNVHPN